MYNCTSWQHALQGMGPLSFAKAQSMTAHWKTVCTEAIKNAQGLPVLFHSEENYDGTTSLSGVVLEPSLLYPESSLPLFLVRFPGGYQHAVNSSEIRSTQPERFEKLVSVVEGVFSASRRNTDFAGPQDLMAHGTSIDLHLFAQDVSMLAN